mgnify:CR=1 FL=1
MFMKSRLPSTKSLQVFLITAKQLNLTRAAEVLNITQGAVSRQIQMLEDLLGVQLFYRKARGLKLTAQGEKFIPHAEDVITRLRKAVVDMSSQSETIKLNAPSCITPWLLPKLMKFQEKYPEIKVELTSTVTHFVTPDFDVFDATIVYGKAPKSSFMDAHLLFEEQLSPVCNPRLLDAIKSHEDQQVGDNIERFTWLHADADHTDWKAWLSHRGYKGKVSKQNQNFPTLDHAMNAALQGFGIAIGDIKLAELDIKAKRLVRPYDDVVLSGMSYFFVHPKNSQHSLLPKLVEQLLFE